MFGSAVIIAQCTWQCHYKDFSQHLIRWCFHAPASIIRLTLASCVLFKCLLDNFHRRKSVCFMLMHHCRLVTPQLDRMQITGSASSQNPRNRVSVHLLEPRCCFWPAELRECTKARVSSVTVIFFWKLDMFPRDYPTLWASGWRKIPLSHLQKCDIRVCYYLVTQAGLKPERTEEESSRYSCKFPNWFMERSLIRGRAATVQPRTAPCSEPFSLLTKTIVWVNEQDAIGCRTCGRMQIIDQIPSCVLMQVRGLMWFWPMIWFWQFQERLCIRVQWCHRLETHRCCSRGHQYFFYDRNKTSRVRKTSAGSSSGRLSRAAPGGC